MSDNMWQIKSRDHEFRNFDITVRKLENDEVWGNSVVIDLTYNGKQFHPFTLNNKQEYLSLLKVLTDISLDDFTF